MVSGLALDYAGSMDSLPELHPRQLYVIVAPRAIACPWMTNIIARLALAGPVRVLDGGNCFDALGLARELSGQTPSLEAALGRVTLARAFTCYQMAALLAPQPASLQPVIILDLLTTFYDENVPRNERLWLLDACLEHLETLRQHVPLAVSAHPSPSRPAGADELLSRLTAHADQVWQFAASSQSSTDESQPRLL